jgi:hypothetical protein
VESSSSSDNRERLIREGLIREASQRGGPALAEHTRIYLTHIDDIDNRGAKGAFEGHRHALNAIVNGNVSPEVLQTATNDFGVLADTVQTYVLHRKCCASLGRLRPRVREMKWGIPLGDLVYDQKEQLKQHIEEINRAGDYYQENRETRHAQFAARQHRSAARKLVNVSRELERLEN